MTTKSGELKLFDNKQLIHIASEVIVLLGLTFYFSTKNKKLLGHIEELAQKLEEQEDHIQKLETSLSQTNQNMETLGRQIMQLGQAVNQLGSTLTTENSRQQPTPVATKENVTLSKNTTNQKHSKPILKEVVKQVPKPPKVQFEVPAKVTKIQEIDDEELEEELEEELDDSDLDDEIRAELNELVEDESSLKKET